MDASTAIRFGRFESRPGQRTLLADGLPAALGARAYDLLQALIERRDRVVGKTELLDLVWPGLIVEEGNLHVQVSTLRKVLGDGVIATVPGRGYRFVAPVDIDRSQRPMDGTASAATAPGASIGRDTGLAARTNLPAEADPLIGRDADIATLADWLDEHRLVTVWGAGGIGKTRLAQSVARARQGAHAGGVWWVDLAALSEAAQIAPAIAMAARMPLEPGDTTAMLLRALADRDTLLVLDNCEHLADEVAALAQAILAAAPAARLLATSQESLRITGEHVYRLDALGVPPPGTPLDEACRFGAVQLLRQRLRAADHRFELAGEMLAVAVELCRQLDGIPLAIEMAAARLPTLGFDAVRRLVAERRLGHTARGTPARQQTLRATLEWSCALLNADEQAVLHRLSVFAGSFRVDAAQQVARAGGLCESAARDAIESLASKSLLQVQRLEPPRLRLLETMRLFAADRLAAEGETERTQQRHSAAMALLADDAEEAYWSVADGVWMQRYLADYDDLQAAFDRCCERQDADGAASTGIAIARADALRSVHWNDARREQVARALLPSAGPLASARLLSFLTPWAGKDDSGADAVARAHARVAAWRALAHRRETYRAICHLAVVSAEARDARAADEALAEARAMEDPAWPPRLLLVGADSAANVSVFSSDVRLYRERCRAELALAQSAGADRSAAWARLKLADAATMAGDFDEAIVLGRRVVAELRVLDQPSNLGVALSNLCAALVRAGDLAAARHAAAEALPLVMRHDRAGLLFDHLALLVALSGGSAQSALLLGFADAWNASTASPREPNEARSEQLAVATIAAAIGEATLARLRARGARLCAADAGALALDALARSSGACECPALEIDARDGSPAMPT